MKSPVLSPEGKKLLDRLKREFPDIASDLADDVVIRRTYAGWSQKAQGAWSWFFYSLKSPVVYDIGSCETVRDLIRCKKITIHKTNAGTELVINNEDYL